MASKFLVFVALSAFVSAACAATCSSPSVTVNSFTTADATVVSKIAHVAELTVKCSNSALPQLFAEVEEGRVVPLARVEGDKYQISWVEEIGKARSGAVTIRLFDDEGFSAIRKVQRDGDKTSSVKSLIDVDVTLTKAYNGPYVSSELVAGLVSLLIAYFAFSTKSKLQA